MLKIRKSQDRGHVEYDWLDTYHTFSFDTYSDPNHVHFRNLRVINEDIVQPSQGFGMHPHKDMEIITYIISGTLEHKDSMGNGSQIKAGDVQRMSAGTGIMHSEFNPSDTEAVHLLQIWVFPEEKNLTPEYDQQNYSDEQKQNKLCLLASPGGKNGSMKIHQDLNLYASKLDKDKSIIVKNPHSRHYWIQLIYGELDINQTTLQKGDGISISNDTKITITAQKNSEFLMFDLK